MAREVAVFVDNSGLAATVYEPGKIVVYRKEQGTWQVAREKAFVLEQGRGMRELRMKMAEAVEFLAECKVFVGRSVTGLPYFELEKASCSIWEFEGIPTEFLDYVMAKEEEAFQQKAQQNNFWVVPAPEERENGCFYISIKEIQENSTGITSKQVLHPFLRKGQFYSLEILCSHVPPWLEAELLDGRFNGVTEKTGDKEVKVTITKKSCCN